MAVNEAAAGPLAILARLLTAEAACASTSLAGALLMAVAGAISGRDLAAVLQLPDAGDRERRAVVRRGHMVEIDGVRLGQLLRLAGAVPIEVGTVDGCPEDELATVLGHGAACGIHIDRSMSSDRPSGDMAAGVWACRQAGVPAIVVLLGSVGPLAALDAGADLVVLDVKRFFGRPALGLILGRTDRIAACELQARGLGGLFGVAVEALAEAVTAVGAAAGDPAGGRAMAAPPDQ
jgi:L-seryl-tRNA(Ser) seleniumtransferase